MRNFVQATEYDVYMYAKFEWLDAYRFFVIKYFKIQVVGILYEAIKHKSEFGQAYYQDLLTRIL
jgi:hypothetical protein